MKASRPALSPLLPPETLLSDYEHWLAFVTTSRQTVREYDRQLAHINVRYPDLSPLSNYLRDRMHYRAQFFGRLAIHLTATVAQLRTQEANAGLLHRLTYTHQAMQTLIDDLKAAFVDIEESYQTLWGTAHTISPMPSIPSYRSNPARS
ncbi:hypothetical protein ACFSUS_18575 [Spirosoma soli]|uniref:Uncharacterized protein n=1 Tax=Spirosoma soli TaxID=1770529 RepID=A0ABW5M8D8_9BACT